jgi:GNAT superfamily N-acetyltransferase
MTILYVPTIDGSRVVQFVAAAWVALMAEGHWSRREVLVSGELQCVFAVAKGNRIVGCITYHVDDDIAVINIAYVVPEHRGKGLYKRLHEAYAIKAKAAGAKTSVNICHADNAPIQKACNSLGYKLHTQEWRSKF